MLRIRGKRRDRGNEGEREVQVYEEGKEREENSKTGSKGYEG
jgi:hypothetical protein